VRAGRGLSPSAVSAGERGAGEGLPYGGVPGRGTGDADKDHKRKYVLLEQHDEVVDVAPAVITDEFVESGIAWQR
jgi:hypothetical protein